MTKTDCHFYKGKCCSALRKIYCSSGKCSFYKTEKQFQDDLVKYPRINYVEYYENKHRNDNKRGVKNE